MKQTGETYIQARNHLCAAYTAHKPDSFYLNEGYLLGNSGPRSELRTDQLFSKENTLSLTRLLPEKDHGGLIVFTGAKNSGKTHTMNAVLNNYLQTHPNNRVIAIETGDEEEWEVPEDSNYLTISPTKPYKYKSAYDLENISDLAYVTLRMTPHLLSIAESPTRKEEYIRFAQQASDTGHITFLELTSPSLSQTIRALSRSANSWQFENLKAIVEQQKFVLNSRNFFLRSVLVFDGEVRRIATEYAESLDEEKFYTQLRAHGVTRLPQSH